MCFLPVQYSPIYRLPPSCCYEKLLAKKSIGWCLRDDIRLIIILYICIRLQPKSNISSIGAIRKISKNLDATYSWVHFTDENFSMSCFFKMYFFISSLKISHAKNRRRFSVLFCTSETCLLDLSTLLSFANG